MSTGIMLGVFAWMFICCLVVIILGVDNDISYYIMMGIPGLLLLAVAAIYFAIESTFYQLKCRTCNFYWQGKCVARVLVRNSVIKKLNLDRGREYYVVPEKTSEKDKRLLFGPVKNVASGEELIPNFSKWLFESP